MPGVTTRPSGDCQVVILDNASFHRHQVLRGLLEDMGCTLLLVRKLIIFVFLHVRIAIVESGSGFWDGELPIDFDGFLLSLLHQG